LNVVKELYLFEENFLDYLYKMHEDFNIFTTTNIDNCKNIKMKMMRNKQTCLYTYVEQKTKLHLPSSFAQKSCCFSYRFI